MMEDKVLDMFDTPRDVHRIDVLLDILGQVWNLCPDMRFGQLIINLSLDDFFKEDDVAISELRDFLNKEYDSR